MARFSILVTTQAKATRLDGFTVGVEAFEDLVWVHQIMCQDSSRNCDGIGRGG